MVRLVISGATLEEELTIPARPTFQARGPQATYHYQVGLMEGAVIGPPTATAVGPQPRSRRRLDPTTLYG